MQVCVSVNGKGVYLLVHRLVAITFISNPHNYPEVNHIDNDPTNNAVSNLEWCSHEYNVAYREKYGVSAKEASKVLRKQVFAVNLETFEVFKFESQREASRQLGIAVGHINGVIKGRLNMAGGYWFTEDKSEITEEKIQEIRDNMKSHPVIAVRLRDLKIIYFKSQSEASIQLGINLSNINKTLKGRRNIAGGYCFYSVNLDAIEKIRTKFGNKVAIKVEELVDANRNQFIKYSTKLLKM